MYLIYKINQIYQLFDESKSIFFSKKKCSFIYTVYKESRLLVDFFSFQLYLVGFGFSNCCIYIFKFYFKREYLYKLLLCWVKTRSLSLRCFMTLSKIVQVRQSIMSPLR